MRKDKFIKGIVDPFSLIVVGFLLLTVITGATVANNKNISLNISKFAMKTLDEGTGVGKTTKTSTPTPTVFRMSPASPTPNPTTTTTTKTDNTSSPTTCDCVYGTLVGIACGASAGLACSLVATPTPTPKPVATPYCSEIMYRDCTSGCTPDLSGGTCNYVRNIPTPGAVSIPTPTPMGTPTPTPTIKSTPSTCNCVYGTLVGIACGASAGLACSLVATPTPTIAPLICNCVYGMLVGNGCGASAGLACSLVATPTPTPKPTIATTCDGMPVGSKKCYGSDGYATCNTIGQWFPQTRCPDETYCQGGECLSVMPDIGNYDHYVCSQSGDYAMLVNNVTSEINWGLSPRCLYGCKDGACIGKDGVDERRNLDCSGDEISFDGFERCVAGKWKCIPGKTRLYSLPGQTLLMDLPLEVCDQDGKSHWEPLDASWDLTSCSGQNIVNSNGKIVGTCNYNEYCLNKNAYSSIEKTGCYFKDYVDTYVFCTNGDTVEPKYDGECKRVCVQNELRFAEPLECIRDTNKLVSNRCEGGDVWHGDRREENCSNGCSYGQCIPEENASCNQGQSYIDNNTKCLMTCNDGKYILSDTCVDEVNTTGNWSDDETVMLLNAIDRFPPSLAEAVKDITFNRLEEVYAFCYDNCTSLAGAYFTDTPENPNTIVLPDFGVNQTTSDHEIMHAINNADPKVLEGFIEAAGCEQDPTNPNGQYIYTETPYNTDRGLKNCNEGLAVGCGEEYMSSGLSCGMKESRPNTYNFCKNNVFDGKEYCDSEAGSWGISSRLIKSFLGMLITPVHASEILPSIKIGSMEDKLSSLIPGTTGIEYIETTMGSPTKNILSGETTIYTYSSEDKSRPHLVHIENKIVTFVQAVLGESSKVTLSEIIKQYGNPEDKSYSTHAHNSLVYSYPTKGISFFIDGNTEKVFMIQKYVPTTQTEFKKNIGKDFKSQPLGDDFQKLEATNSANTITNSEKATIPSIITIIIYVATSIITITILVILYKKFVKVIKKIKIKKGRNEFPKPNPPVINI